LKEKYQDKNIDAENKSGGVQGFYDDVNKARLGKENLGSVEPQHIPDHSGFLNEHAPQHIPDHSGFINENAGKPIELKEIKTENKNISNVEPQQIQDQSGMLNDNVAAKQTDLKDINTQNQNVKGKSVQSKEFEQPKKEVL